MKTVIITAAENMSDETYNRICSGFKEKLGEDAEFKRITDNGIIGGFIAEVDGEIYDLSISSQLKKMQKEIIG
ncbi:MAG: F0F1 ATP synthase subunit delta [Acutalibacteraceae bacterium]|nr:F0F1 ATP synthase subunit delta [Clostridia bacterium]MEE1329923.1 F0F1 ATP synthase subunit delta [Acutalibacteraceae bacterium]